MLQELLKNVKASNYSQALRYARSLLGSKARIYRVDNKIQVGFDGVRSSEDAEGSKPKQRYILGEGPDYSSALKHMAMVIANSFAQVRAEQKLQTETAQAISEEKAMTEVGRTDS